MVRFGEHTRQEVGGVAGHVVGSRPERSSQVRWTDLLTQVIDQASQRRPDDPLALGFGHAGFSPTAARARPAQDPSSIDSPFDKPTQPP
jgi:hypothetical protein